MKHSRARDREFVDALREVLGLAPLYRSEVDPMLKFAQWMKPHARMGGDMVSKVTGASEMSQGFIAL